MVLGARQANQLHRLPPCTVLASGEALAGICLQPGCCLFKAAGDVECCFYQFTMPPIGCDAPSACTTCSSTCCPDGFARGLADGIMVDS